ncbi:MAG: TonB-dependent receptor [Lentisphaeria bacterium]|nr:TonB-dependent receptor [Lentisphaeria bacterium]
MNVKRLLAGATLFVSFLPGTIIAQETSKETATDVIASSETKQAQEAEEGIVELPPVFITATPQERDLVTIPAATTVITRSDLDEMPIKNVSEALRYVPGINVRDYGSGDRSSQVDVRGFGETGPANSIILVDGRKLNNSTLKSPDLSTIPLANVERIEVLRGGGAVLYGNGATGGVINIITKRGAQEDRLDVQLYTSEYTQYQLNTTLSGGNDKFSYLFTWSKQEQDGYRDNGDYDYNAFDGRVNLTPNEFFNIDFMFGYKDDEYGLPGFVQKNEKFSSTNEPENNGNQRNWFITIVPEYQLDEASAIKLQFDYDKTSSYAYYLYTGPFVDIIRNELRKKAFKPNITYQFETGAAIHDLTFGVDFIETDSKNVRGSLDATFTEVAAYIYDEIELSEQWFLDAGIRFANLDYDYKEQEDSDDNVWAANLGVTYLANEDTKLFASFQRAYRSQLLDELIYSFSSGSFVNPEIDTQISYTYQTGIEHYFTDQVKGSATIFFIDTNDEIFLNPYTFANTSYDNTERYGIELAVDYQITEKLKTFANFTYVETKLDGGEFDGNEIPGAPKYSGSFGLNWQIVDALSWDIRGYWVNDQYPISDWENDAPSSKYDDSWVVVDTKLTWSITDSLSVFGGINNLFDEDYAETTVYSKSSNRVVMYPNNAQEFFAGVNWSYTF